MICSQRVSDLKPKIVRTNGCFCSLLQECVFGMQSIAILELQKLGKNALVKLSVEAMRDISLLVLSLQMGQKTYEMF